MCLALLITWALMLTCVSNLQSHKFGKKKFWLFLSFWGVFRWEIMEEWLFLQCFITSTFLPIQQQENQQHTEIKKYILELIMSFSLNSGLLPCLSVALNPQALVSGVDCYSQVDAKCSTNFHPRNFIYNQLVRNWTYCRTEVLIWRLLRFKSSVPVCISSTSWTSWYFILLPMPLPVQPRDISVGLNSASYQGTLIFLGCILWKRMDSQNGTGGRRKYYSFFTDGNESPESQRFLQSRTRSLWSNSKIPY